MNRLRVLLLVTLILLSASLLLGQPPRLQENQSGQPAVCNDGTIPFSVARAHRHAKDILFGGGRWEIWGWYNVDPGKCTAIGPGTVFEPGGWLGNGDALTLLAFAFVDSKGTFRGVKVQPGDSGWFYPIYPSNQQICVQTGEFQYTRDSLEQSDLARVCDRASPGYMLIPASFMYKGSVRTVPLFGGPDLSPDYVHVKIADDRAITSGQTIGSGGTSHGLGGGGTSQGSGNATSSMCGKVSCWDQFLQSFNQALKENNVQRAAANANNNPTPSAAPRPVVSPARVPVALPQRPRLAPIMVGKVDVSHLAGLQRGDIPEYVSSIFGPPTSGPEQDSSAFGGYPHRGSDGFSIRVNYDLNNVLSRMKVYSKGSRGAMDPLLDLLGKGESAAIALLGPPNTREYGSDIDNIDLYWTFSMNGRTGPQYVGVASPQTLTLHFRTGVGCESVALVW